MRSTRPVCLFVTEPSLSQVGLYHDQQAEDGGSSKENRNIYSESMPRRVGSFYRGWFSHSLFLWLRRSTCQFSLQQLTQLLMDYLLMFIDQVLIKHAAGAGFM